MKFNRTELMTTIENRIAEAHVTASEKYAEAVADYKTARELWLASDHGQYFVHEADKLKEKALRDVVTSDDLKPFSYSWSDHPAREHVFSARVPEYQAPNVNTLSQLLEFLRAVTDEEVSSSGLRDVGFRNVAQILRNVN